MGPEWVFEIKHEGYRLMVRKDDERVRVYTRRGTDWTERYPRVVAAVRSLKVRSVLLDGEGIVYDHKGMPSFDRLHSRDYDKEVSLAAFDLLELDGADLRKQKLLDRKARLAKLLSKVIRDDDYRPARDLIAFEMPRFQTIRTKPFSCHGSEARAGKTTVHNGRSSACLLRRLAPFERPDQRQRPCGIVRRPRGSES